MIVIVSSCKIWGSLEHSKFNLSCSRSYAGDTLVSAWRGREDGRRIKEREECKFEKRKMRKYTPATVVP